jgi:peptide/nickel transport system substrate-binding protein
MARPDQVQSLQRELIAGQINRRDFIRRALALGLTASAVGAALAACGTTTPTATTAPASVAASAAPSSAAASASTGGAASAAPSVAASAAPSSAAAAAATPAASAAASAAAAVPSMPGPTKRGGGGALKLIQWQAPTILNPHLSSGTKDDLVCAIIYEGLLRIDQEGNFFPFLAESIPSAQNGLLATDGKSVTWKLKSGLKWSDGQPVTADDCVLTWQYVTDPKTAATTLAFFENVATVEAVDPLTVKYTFTEPKPDWYRPAMAQILPKHIFEKDKGEPARTSPNNLKPVGTGPYKVTNFAPGDVVSYAINENYREATKPFFDTVEVKGGGDAQSAARAVLQTGDFDYAWNLQIEDTVIKQLETGGKGVAEFYNGGGIERNFLNFADPNTEVGGERSSLNSKHPFLTDLKVRQALAFATDRKTVVETLYGRAGAIGINFLEDPPIYRSANTAAAGEYNLDKANALLEEAGWVKGGDGVRAKGGVKMNVVYLSTVNSVRQKTQQIVKDGWEKIGLKVEIKAVDSAVFFSSDVGNPDTSGKMYVDVQMYTTSAAFDPATHMKRWTTTNAKLTQREGKWSGGNDGRYINTEYDKLWDAAKTELDSNKRAQLFIQMNDILVNDVAMIAIVNRKTAFARATALKNANYSQWAGNYWNIANWMK